MFAWVYLIKHKASDSDIGVDTPSLVGSWMKSPMGWIHYDAFPAIEMPDPGKAVSRVLAHSYDPQFDINFIRKNTQDNAMWSIRETFGRNPCRRVNLRFLGASMFWRCTWSCRLPLWGLISQKSWPAVKLFQLLPCFGFSRKNLQGVWVWAFNSAWSIAILC